MNVLFIIRGIPGSGKSTLAELVSKTAIAADDYFIDSAGNYNFDPSRLKEAHEYCQNRTRDCMIDGEPTIAVANTFTQEWEMKPYVELANEFGYMVHTIVVENRHGGKNIHGVPDEVLVRMRNRFELKL